MLFRSRPVEQRGARSETDRPTGRRSAAAVRTEDVQHPLDRQALAALKNVPGLDDLIRFLFEKGFEKVFRIQNLSSAVRVSPAHFPGLYDMYRGVVERLGVHPVPPLYVRGGPLNAWTTGVEEPFIVLTSAMVNITTPAELEYVIGHELGHIRCQHVLYNTLANNLAMAGLAERDAAERILEDLGHDRRIRAEAIAPTGWPVLLDAITVA